MDYRKIFAAGILLTLAGCATKPAAYTAREGVKEAVLDANATLIDVRIPEQFAAKTAPGAVNIPLKILNDSIAYFKKQEKVVIFCNSGKQAGEAMEILRRNGVQNIFDAKTLKNVEAIQMENKESSAQP